ncbi:MAG: dihydrodipicolinate synthase family protein, partial [Dehalococcoidia bacterium]
MPEIRGVITATVTPFTRGGEKVDLEWIPQHLDYLRRNGADAVLITGTNGEGPSLSLRERRAIIDTVLAHRQGLGVMVGTGCSALPDTIEVSRYALEQGADAVLVVPPFYFKGLSDVGLIDYYVALFDALPSDGKVALYNIPKLSGVEITDHLVEALLDRYPSRFLGIKDTSGSIEQTRHFI